jgi:hypothetical protein
LPYGMRSTNVREAHLKGSTGHNFSIARRGLWPNTFSQGRMWSSRASEAGLDRWLSTQPEEHCPHMCPTQWSR